MIDPWHGTHEDRPDWDRPGFATLVVTAAALWLVGLGQIRWLVRRLR